MLFPTPNLRLLGTCGRACEIVDFETARPSKVSSGNGLRQQTARTTVRPQRVRRGMFPAGHLARTLARTGEHETKTLQQGRTPILLHVIARGKIARSPEAELVARYEKRLTWPVRLTELPEIGGRHPDPQIPCKTVLLDERGKTMGSEDFAHLLGRWRDDGLREARFVLGAADGHSKEDRAQADLLLAFGPATWPHLMARAMLMEQLYRATSILAGHPYHRA
mgnify:CR=1 FL=1